MSLARWLPLQPYWYYQLALVFVLNSPLLAHPGHGNPQVTSSSVHYLTDPFHLTQLTLLVIAIVVTLRYLARILSARGNRFID